MNKTRNDKRIHRARRVRSKVTGTSQRPRMNVFRSSKSMYVQIIDDSKNNTIVSARLGEIKGAKNDIDGAKQLGALVAKKAIKKGIEEIVFDRAGYKYHGKVRAIAEGARSGGLKF